MAAPTAAMVEEVEKTCSINEKRVDSLAERTCRFTLAARSPAVCVFFFLFGCFVCVCVGRRHRCRCGIGHSELDVIIVLFVFRVV